jgi:hypothetical protein
MEHGVKRSGLLVPALALVGTSFLVIGPDLAHAQMDALPIHADFNGDGFDDVATGVPAQYVAASAAGAVNVLYGSSAGVQADSPDDQFWNQNSEGVRETAEDSDNFGAVLAAGDFNGDGFADLAVGAPGEEVGGFDRAGKVSVLYGSSGGLQAVAPDDQVWSQDSDSVRDAAAVNEQFGSALTTGDFNGDGFDDLAAGVPYETVNGFGYAGAVNVLYGSSGGLQAVAPNDQFWHQEKTGIKDTAESGDVFGLALEAGDIDANGFDDLAAGIPGEAVGTVLYAGAVAAIYGSSGGLKADSPDDEFWHQNKKNVDDAAESNDSFGSSLAAGDFNDDGFVDLGIGAPHETVSDFSFAGALNVLYGQAGGLQASSPADQFWHQDSPGVQDDAEDGDDFGYSLAAADFNADGAADLVIGINEDTPTLVAGAVSVFYGSLGGLQVDAPDDQLWTQDSTGVLDASEIGDQFGRTLSSGDFNTDGRWDLVVGIQKEGVELAGEDAGAVAVLYGSIGRVQADSPDDQFWSQNSPGVQDVAEAGEEFGWGLP